MLEGRQLLTIAIGEKAIPVPASFVIQNPRDITAGPDGNVWFTEMTHQVGRITPAGDVTTFALPDSRTPSQITAGPDGNLWFVTDLSALIVDPPRPAATAAPASPLASFAVGRMTPTGEYTKFALPEGINEAGSIAAGPDGNLWVTAGRSIVRYTTAGDATVFPLPSGEGLARQITAGPDGNLWFGEAGRDAVGRITPDGAVTEFPIPSLLGQQPGGITAGPDGNLWLVVFTQSNAPGTGRLERITPAGVVTEFPLPGHAQDVAAGADGNLWVTSGTNHEVMRVTTDGAVTVFQTPTFQTTTNAITAGPDGNLWFTEGLASRIGQVVLDAPPDAPLTAAPVASFAATEGELSTGPVATFTDADHDTQPGDYTARIEWGDGFTTDGRIVADGRGGFVVNGSRGYYDEGTYPVKVTIFDTKISNPGATATVTTTAFVAEAPLVPLGQDIQLYRGQTDAFLVAGVRTNDFDQAFTATIDWGDGTSSPGDVRVIHEAFLDLPMGTGAPGMVTRPAQLPNGALIFGRHVYVADGTYTVHVTVSDDEGATVVVTSTIHFSSPPINPSAGAELPAHVGTAIGPLPIAQFRTLETLPASLFSAQVDWGDGTAPVAGKVIGSHGYFEVVSTHTYARVGTYRVRVTIVSGETTAEVLGRVAVTATDLKVDGGLDPASDTGASHADGITSAAHPRFSGTATPGALVQLYARRGGTRSIPLGSDYVDARGHWSVVPTTVLAEATYQVVARVTGYNRPTVEVILKSGGSGRTLTIDRAAPRVGRVALNPRTSQLVVSFGDNLSGLDPRTLSAAGNYTVSRMTTAGLEAIPVGAVAVAPGDSTVVLALGRRPNLGRRLADGDYVLTIRSGGVRDRQGNALDGEFSGALPSGDRRPGGDFTVRFHVEGGRATPPRPLVAQAVRTPRGPLAVARRPAPGRVRR